MKGRLKDVDFRNRKRKRNDGLANRASRIGQLNCRSIVRKTLALRMSVLCDSFPPSEAQSVEHSPTPTPHPTRAGTPTHEKLLDRSGGAATTKETMAALNQALVQPQPAMLEETKTMRVSLVDGSAKVSVATKLNYLMLYFIFNLGLTLYNKAIMIKVRMIPRLARFRTQRHGSAVIQSYEEELDSPSGRILESRCAKRSYEMTPTHRG